MLRWFCWHAADGLCERKIKERKKKLKEEEKLQTEKKRWWVGDRLESGEKQKKIYNNRLSNGN